jgi:hypothetical protein
MRSRAWHCQVVHSAREEDAVVIDLIALDDCPSDSLGCPRHTPFSLHIGGGALGDRWWHRTVRAWANTADQITIVCGVGVDGGSWMCLTSDDRELVLQL